MYGWVLASTSGFTRREIGAILPILPATSLMRCNSGIDSTLKQRMPTSNARSISLCDFATPEKTTFEASPPETSTRSNSPCDTMSKPEPSFAITFNRAIFEFDFTAKQIKCGCVPKELSKACQWRSSVARE